MVAYNVNSMNTTAPHLASKLALFLQIGCPILTATAEAPSSPVGRSPSAQIAKVAIDRPPLREDAMKASRLLVSRSSFLDLDSTRGLYCRAARKKLCPFE